MDGKGYVPRSGIGVGHNTTSFVFQQLLMEHVIIINPLEHKNNILWDVPNKGKKLINPLRKSKRTFG
jgi:hypothetical protein